MIFGRRAPQDLLRVHAPREDSWRCELPPGTLAARFVEPAAPAWRAQWELTGQFHFEQLRPRWPAAEVHAESAWLVHPRGRKGLALDVELGEGGDPAAEGATLRERLLGLEPVRREEVVEVHAEPVEEPPPRAAPSSAREAPMPSAGATGGLFDAAGEMLDDHDRRVRVEDLAWLNPGDLLYSPRRGSVRVKRVEEEARQAVVRDAEGRMLVVGFDELAKEYAFED